MHDRWMQNNFVITFHNVSLRLQYTCRLLAVSPVRFIVFIYFFLERVVVFSLFSWQKMKSQQQLKY